MLNSRVHLSLQILLVLSSRLLATSTILTSDIGGDDDTVLLCPNEVITLTCQTTSSALAWYYPTGLIYNSDSDINDPKIKNIDGGTIEFTLTDRMDTNYTSTAIVNTTTDITISCSPDGSPSDVAVTITVKDIPPSPNVSVTDIQTDRISLQWEHEPTADSYHFTISPSPVGGACASGTCSVISNNITIDNLPLDKFQFTITVSSINCAGTGPSVVITESTLPKAITEVGTDAGIIDDATNILVCPDEAVNITCQTKQALVWLISDAVEIFYENKSSIMERQDINGFNYTLIEIDGVDFTSLVEPKINTSYNISCSPTGVAKDPLNSDIIVTVIDVPAQPTNLVIKTLCLYDAELEWDYDEGADDYYITVHPSPARGVCEDGACTDDLYVYCNETTNKCTGVIDGLDDKEHVYTLQSINCAGMSQPATITSAVTVEVPPVAEIASLKEFDNAGDDNHIDIFLEWTSPNISCQTPSIDNFTVTITAYGDPEFHTVNCCNYTFKLDRCGVYSFLVEPRNKVGTGPRSLPWSTRRTGVFSLSTTLSKTTDDSASIEVTVSKCLIPAVTNVTIMLSRQTADVIQQLSLQYPVTSLFINQTIEELDAETEYNATVIIFYLEFGSIRSLTTMVSFTTSAESLLSLQNIVIGSLTGFGVLGIIIIVLIIIIGLLCLRDGYRKKQIRRLTRRQTEHRTKLRELQHTVHETHANTEALAQVQRRTEAPVHHNQVASPSRLYPELTNEYATNNTYL